MSADLEYNDRLFQLSNPLMENDLISTFDEFNCELNQATRVFSRTKIRNCPKARPRRSPFKPPNHAAGRPEMSNSPSFTDAPFMTTLTPPKSPNTKSNSIDGFSNKRRKTRTELYETAESTTMSFSPPVKRSDIVFQMQSLREMDNDEESEQVLIWSSSDEESEGDSDLSSSHNSNQGSHIMAKRPMRARES